ncbi:lipoprotein, putative [Pseudooceanicola batsensis HTCC2597]|uniref:Lipoprotein, putative n=1 Tax=Pseudooceanicola batsensis (strain ATCC BAA-863 / DSM 15984 / KCTC 12145 / HTCC2597) TaxID=252305 RepID=A3TUL5_PSEBH|nr:peptidoglycan-binding domain-containing protein [Pseudooceanicola batsensis]EAQ04211.1 lipoprotein, putative [Pseudooceanicola batsensis HTCC2597]
MIRGSRSATAGTLALVLLAACDLPLPVPGLGAPEIIRIHSTPPPGSPPGACWGREATPAVIETVTEQILLQPAQVRSDGTVEAPAVYKTETRQRIVKERRELWFRTPCPPELTFDFVASLQRALAARGLYRGQVNGVMDRATRHAVRRYQAPLGLDSGILSLAGARKLGLAVVDPKRVDAPEAPGQP